MPVWRISRLSFPTAKNFYRRCFGCMFSDTVKEYILAAMNTTGVIHSIPTESVHRYIIHVTDEIN